MILLRVSLFFIVLLLLPDWYIYKVYIKYSSINGKKDYIGCPQFCC